MSAGPIQGSQDRDSLHRRVYDDAWFSEDGVYRFALTRELGGDRTAVFAGCNPSTADAFVPDPTITKDVGFATRWGMGRIVKVNANAYKATDPDDMHAAAKAGIDVVGPGNDRAIALAVAAARETDGVVVLGCGNHISMARIRQVVEIVQAGGMMPMCLWINKNGTPKHELYIKYEQPLIPFVVPAAVRP